MDAENNPDLQETPEIPEDDEKALSDVQAGDSYDELAKDAPVAMEPPIPKRGRGRPLGSKNKKRYQNLKPSQKKRQSRRNLRRLRYPSDGRHVPQAPAVHLL